MSDSSVNVSVAVTKGAPSTRHLAAAAAGCTIILSTAGPRRARRYSVCYSVYYSSNLRVYDTLDDGRPSPRHGTRRVLSSRCAGTPVFRIHAHRVARSGCRQPGAQTRDVNDVIYPPSVARFARVCQLITYMSTY